MITKVFSRGIIYNKQLYKELQELDARCFPGCGNEFHRNRDWWVILDKGLLWMSLQLKNMCVCAGLGAKRIQGPGMAEKNDKGQRTGSAKRM